MRGDRPILERVASRDIDDREAVEEAYREGDAAMRAGAARRPRRSIRDAAPLDLLRLAVFGLDVDLGKAARKALAETKSSDATTLISEALQVPMETAERDALIAALKRLGDDSAAGPLAGRRPRGSRRRVVGRRSDRLGQGARGRRAVPPRSRRDPLEARAENKARAAYERPDDPDAAARVRRGHARAGARDAPAPTSPIPHLGKRFERHLYADALRVGLEAEKLGATGWRVNAVLALAAYYTRRPRDGLRRAPQAAMKDLPARRVELDVHGGRHGVRRERAGRRSRRP